MPEWVAEQDLERPGSVRLFCLPHGGSGSAGFHRWKRMLPGWIAVCPVTLPGRDGRMAEAPMRTVAEIVEGLHGSVAGRLGERPYAVFGHSMGALLGFEWVRRIARDGIAGPVRLFCSGREGPQFGREGVSGLGDEAFLHALGARYGDQALALLQDREMRALFLPVLRADLEVVESYAMTAGAQVGCGVSAYAGVADTSVADEKMRGWDEVSGAGFRMERFAGDHFYSFGAGQAGLLPRLEAELRVTGADPGAWGGRG